MVSCELFLHKHIQALSCCSPQHAPLNLQQIQGWHEAEPYSTLPASQQPCMLIQLAIHDRRSRLHEGENMQGVCIMHNPSQSTAQCWHHAQHSAQISMTGAQHTAHVPWQTQGLHP
jgi:hypothetical protein